MTPGTGAKGRKTVSFGAQVADNEGQKATKIGKSGIPDDCPGKFPSPWTPGTALLSDKKPRTKLTAALYDARDSSQAKSEAKSVAEPSAKHDQDLTMDFMEPRSESGKYWKEQYESYAEKSEREMRKLIKKESIAKSYAKKKDSDAIELDLKLQEEKKRHRQQERILEEQMKDYQEHLRQAMAETLRASMEISTLKQQLAAAQKRGSDKREGTKQNPVHVHEDRAISPPKDHRATIMAKPVLPAARETETVESPSVRPRRPRRSTAPDASDIATPASILGIDQSKTLLSVRPPTTNKENLSPKSPANAIQTSSPDCWLQQTYTSTPGDLDRMAMPLSSAPLPARLNTTSKVERPSRTRQSTLRKKASVGGEAVSGSLRAEADAPSSVRQREPVLAPVNTEREKLNDVKPKRSPEEEERKRRAKERLERRRAEKGVESQAS
jgi:hypothetical protein